MASDTAANDDPNDNLAERADHYGEAKGDHESELSAEATSRRRPCLRFASPIRRQPSAVEKTTTKVDHLPTPSGYVGNGRPIEPVVQRGRGMHVLGFVTASMFQTSTPSKPSDAVPTKDSSTRQACKLGKEQGPRAENEQLDGHAKEAEVEQQDEKDVEHEQGGIREDDEYWGEGSWSKEGGWASEPWQDVSSGDQKRCHEYYSRQHGNYHRYYSQRYAGAQWDPLALDRRLISIQKEIGKTCFEGLKVMDIGCNSGEISLSIAKNLNPKRVVGVEIDEGLVKTANSRRDEWLAEGRTVEAWPSDEEGDCQKSEISKCEVEFRCEDILETLPRILPSGEPECFDAIVCFSVTKWIHFSKGDSGVRKLFRRCFKRLVPGGKFILEPQEWSSYKKKKHITKEILETVKGIEMRPSSFVDYLVKIGFEHTATIEPPAQGPQGFRRKIHIVTKPGEQPDADEQGGQNESEFQLPVPSGKENRKVKKRNAAEGYDIEISEMGPCENDFPKSTRKRKVANSGEGVFLDTTQGDEDNQKNKYKRKGVDGKENDDPEAEACREEDKKQNQNHADNADASEGGAKKREKKFKNTQIYEEYCEESRRRSKKRPKSTKT